MSGADGPLEGSYLTEAISAAMVALYARFYGHDRTTAITYINDDVVVCILKDILTTDERRLVDDGSPRSVIDGRVAFQTDTEDEFTAAVERLTRRTVVAFMSAADGGQHLGLGQRRVERRRGGRPRQRKRITPRTLGASAVPSAYRPGEGNAAGSHLHWP